MSEPMKGDYAAIEDRIRAALTTVPRPRGIVLDSFLVEIPRGSLRARGEDGEWWYASPNSPLFSTMTMVAEEYYDDGEWRQIFPNEDDSKDR